MVLSLFQYLDSVNFENFLTKTFNLTEIERKNIFRRQCCHERSQNRKKKINFFPIFFLIFPKVQVLEEDFFFSDSGGSSRHFDYLFPSLCLIVKL